MSPTAAAAPSFPEPDDAAAPEVRPRLHVVEAPPAPPDPAEAAEGLARSVLEILAGARDLEQVARWVTGEVYSSLQKRVRLAARAREASGVRVQRPSFRVGSVHVSRPTPTAVESVVVVHGRARTRSVAIRLEWLGSRWRATALHVL